MKMQFTISKNEDNGWNLKPMSGMFEGQTVATAEGVTLQDVMFAGRTAIGTIRAVWGMSIVMEDVYADLHTLRGLHIGGTFNVIDQERLTLDFDGYSNAANRLCKAAKRLMVIGNQIYGKGTK